jgi:hypothetical protein
MDSEDSSLKGIALVSDPMTRLCNTIAVTAKSCPQKTGELNAISPVFPA